ncbi:SdiA-regulated domain-containing protein [Celeribacter sp. PS-C1]|uniref:SdiA-regulated domain-containing protein n=1 Tax=Celeribacter sp. PS-C1 TaxID=2820813 RepID=UPI001CA57959|nr:SdiA-regulated domain-containing protein [Celeribacter sp. PS-C1]MBW6417805.1 SdiA-regulated domain-containing protein [Celeribacter sp. PS-C1]
MACVQSYIRCALLFLVGGIASPVASEDVGDPVALEFLGSWKIYAHHEDFEEPSGLVFDPETEEFLVISDNTDRFYSLSASGERVKDIGVIDHLEDPEGVTLDVQRGRLLVLSEDQAAIYVIPRDTPENVEKYALKKVIENASDEVRDLLEGRFSPEGITIDATTGAVLLVNERSPRVLVELSPDLTDILSVEPLSAENGFVVERVKEHHLDVSGLDYDAGRNALWIVSDTGESAFFWRRGQGPAQRFELLWKDDGGALRRIENAEGIALNPAGDRLFIINDNDKKSRLFVYAVH